MLLTTEPMFVPTPEPIAQLERMGDEIAELSAHLEAATARLLDLIREFDARGGWNNGFRTCAEWLSWRVGLDPGAAREKVRVARALGGLPLLAGALARGGVPLAEGGGAPRRGAGGGRGGPRAGGRRGRAGRGGRGGRGGAP